ncbi:phytoene desaturase [Tuwongella immobilis]|uniref:Phytoene dehydrogenase n=1 Tax=Tuwongella immobilis TaxID=692036 RepID=A0A6C2YMS4_9BACT|nr:phytoene desaturase [Tuwongella immobilis]VIP02736.1 phytoene dehydrogenase : Phytoene desaturase OS=Haliangium ochraceum (strain DSM 14365 / JCM 11303 / SMP-2) GN=Hoch_2211 PE=4 SV=1: Amino_oxidase [Tuwongella immobilis]VTS02298.1 phytoene dehydrogenase : Phytoene desaturase OS=Haliangium ochraceum (strain DSM 14365 / JCM 11303 / SMP-2) GN=Hoch_2211 PE=4 SV=1: Amino_oxidase [Tuwongella immobilis]
MSNLRAAVIGSGFGGLAAACRLQALGIQTTLLEARDQPGGRAAVYRDAGFTFDAGPTVITAPECLEEVFQSAGRNLADYVELLPVSPMYRLVWPDGVTFDYVQSEERLLEQIRRIQPNDVDGYRRFAAYSKQVFQKGYVELGAKPFLHFWDMVRAAPHLAKLRADRSVYHTVARFLSDEHLRQAFSFHPLLVGGNPYETSAVYTLIHHIEREWGVYFPRGGTGALVNAFVRLFQDIGGELRLNSPVQAVHLGPSDRTRIAPRHYLTTPTKTAEPFDIVLSNADLHHTYGHIYREVPAAAKMRQSLERMEWSMSLMVIYFGTRIRYPDLAHHTILFGPRYKGLLDDIFHGHSLPDDFSLYLHAPTVTDPSLAPEGCEAFYVLSPVPHLGKAPIDWDIEGPRYAERILESLEATHLPGLRQHLVTQKVFTPKDFQTVWNAHQGSAFSVAPRLTQSAYFRPHNRDAQIPGLYLVGAGTHPGAGVPGVVNSAKATLSVIAEEYRL